jgi:hypothetical protein
VTLTRNGRRLVLAAAITALVAALLPLVAAGRSQQANASPMKAMQGMAGMKGMKGPKLSAKAAEFSFAMDKLWEDHITWTRMVIVDFAAGLPDLPTAEARLLRNQADIGNAIKPYYGAAAGNQLTKLLRTHILEAVPVLQAAKAGDATNLSYALATWEANARQIAAFLTKANPRAWPLAMTTSMMKEHLALTTKEAAARLNGNWAADVAAYDQVHAEILQMSHMLSSGIIRQFPNRF